MNTQEIPVGSGTVLFVDPFATICEVVSLILRNSGYEARTTTSTADALRIASSGERFDLLLMDGELPLSEKQALADGFLVWHPDAVVLELSQPRHPDAMFTGKTLLGSIADALRSRSGSRVQNGALV